MYCTNSLLGGFERGHPFLKKVLRRMIYSYRETIGYPAYKGVVLGGHLFIDALVNSTLTPNVDHLLRLSSMKWPNLYDLDRFQGFFPRQARHLPQASPGGGRGRVDR